MKSSVVPFSPPVLPVIADMMVYDVWAVNASESSDELSSTVINSNMM